MARTVNQEEYNARRGEILDAAQRLIYAKGYERMTIQDIRGELGMSSGAFFHYFPSKAAVLEALIERGQPALDQLLVAVVDDPERSAVEKLQGFFDTLNHLRLAQRALIADLARIWFADENAIVREKTDDVIVERRAPLLNAIARQGIEEGVFTTPYPDQAGIAILAITRGMSNALLRRMLAFEQGREVGILDEIVAISYAMSEAIERVLGASAPILDRPDAGTVQLWFAAPEEEAGTLSPNEGALN